MDPFSIKECKKGWQTSMTTIQQRLDFVYHANLFSDVWIKVRNDRLDKWEVFPANKVILAASSPVFSSMFYGDGPEMRKEHAFENLSPTAFRKMLRYIYTNEVNLKTFNETLDLIEIAKLFKLTTLQITCEVFLAETDIQLDEVCRTLQRAEALKVYSLKEKCFEIIQEKGKYILMSEEFLNCNTDTVEAILSLHNFQRRYGYVVFENVFRWAAHQASTYADGRRIPRDYVFRLLPKLNFFSLSVEELNCLLEDHKLIFTETESSDLLRDLINYKEKELPETYETEILGQSSHPSDPKETELNIAQEITSIKLDNIPKLYDNAAAVLFSLKVTGTNQPLLLPGMNISWKVSKNELPVEVSLMFEIRIYEPVTLDIFGEAANCISEKLSFQVINGNSVHIEFGEPYQLTLGQRFIVDMKAKFKKPVSLYMANTLCNVVVCSPRMTDGHACEFNQEILSTEIRSRQIKQLPPKPRCKHSEV